ncbi:unnamed protein product, partial [Cyprideis torosa]
MLIADLKFSSILVAVLAIFNAFVEAPQNGKSQHPLIIQQVTKRNMVSDIKPKRTILMGPDGKQLDLVGIADVYLQLRGEKRRMTVHVLEDIKSDYDMILGVDGLKAFGACLDFRKGSISGDLEDLVPALSKDPAMKKDPLKFSAALKGRGSYQAMLRILKKYDFSSIMNPEVAPGAVVAFSSYPGLLYSGDDFHLLSSGL